MESLDRELETQEPVQQAIVGTVRQAILVLDQNDVITIANEGVLRLWNVSEPLVGKCIFNTALLERSSELGDCLRRSRVTGSDLLEFKLHVRLGGEERSLLVVVRAVLDLQKSRLGTLIYAEDVSHQDTLRATAEELEATSEELYSLHKELQRAGELRSTNEELQATNEALNSLNEAFETVDNDLETHKRELDEVNCRYAETLEHMLCPILLVNNESKIVVWNAAAQKLFGVEAKAVVGLQVQELPLSLSLRNALSRKIAGVFFKQNSTTSTSKTLKMRSFTGKVEMRFTPVNGPSLKAVLVILKATRAERRLRDPVPNSMAALVGTAGRNPQCVEERQDAKGNCVESPYLPVSRDRSWLGLSGTEFIENSMIFNHRQSCCAGLRYPPSRTRYPITKRIPEIEF